MSSQLNTPKTITLSLPELEMMKGCCSNERLHSLKYESTSVSNTIVVDYLEVMHIVSELNQLAMTHGNSRARPYMLVSALLSKQMSLEVQKLAVQKMKEQVQVANTEADKYHQLNLSFIAAIPEGVDALYAVIENHEKGDGGNTPLGQFLREHF